MPTTKDREVKKLKDRFQEIFFSSSEYHVYQLALAAADFYITGGKYTYDFIEDEFTKLGINVASWVANRSIDPSSEPIYAGFMSFLIYERVLDRKIDLGKKYVPYIAARVSNNEELKNIETEAPPSTSKGPMLHHKWIHGNAGVIELPSSVELFPKAYALELTGEANSINWLHYAIPTPVYFSDRRTRLESIGIVGNTESSEAQIRDIHIYDGDMRIAFFNNINLSGNFMASLPSRIFSISEAPDIRYGLGVSLGLDFGGDPRSRRIRIESIGANLMS